MSLLSFPALVISMALTSVLPPPPEQILAIPEDLIAQTQHVIAARSLAPERRLEGLIDFVSAREQLGFRYAADATHTVTETFTQREGNCLSFTLLFLSLARELGLAAHAREVRVPPIWEDEGDTLFDIGHVNVGVDTPSRHRTVDFDPDFLRSQRLAAPWRGQPISDQRALAHFYNNRAAQLLGRGMGPLARPWLDQARRLDPDFVPALNTLGVIERRAGHLERAAAHFERALSLQPDAASVLFNLIGLAEQKGEVVRAQSYRTQLLTLHPDDPWFQWQLGRSMARSGDLSNAASAYQRAFDLNPRQNRFSTALIQTLEHLNRHQEADLVRTRARRFSIASSAQNHPAQGPKKAFKPPSQRADSAGPQQ